MFLTSICSPQGKKFLLIEKIKLWNYLEVIEEFEKNSTINFVVRPSNSAAIFAD